MIIDINILRGYYISIRYRLPKEDLKMMEKIQKFGGAMFTPVMLFAVSAVLIGFGILFTNEQILGSIAAEGTFWR